LRNDVNVDFKKKKQKNLEIKIFLAAILKVTDENCRIRSRIRSRIQIRYSEEQIRGYGPKCHGSATLLGRTKFLFSVPKVHRNCDAYLYLCKHYQQEGGEIPKTFGPNVADDETSTVGV
jgi:hypothetical protein